MVHPYEDSDSSEDEVDWQDTRHDPYRAGKQLRAGPKTTQQEEPPLSVFGATSSFCLNCHRDHQYQSIIIKWTCFGGKE